MFVILNSKMQPEVWYVRAQILANPSFRVAVLYPVNVSRIPHRILVKFRMKGIPFKTGMKTPEKLPAWPGGLPSSWSSFSAPWFPVTEYIPPVVVVIVVIRNL